MQTRSEESQQLRSKFNYGRAGIFVGHHEAESLSPDRVTTLSRQSDIETGATLGLSDLRKGPVLYLLPDSVWVSTNRGSVEQGEALAYQARPMEKSSVGMTRAWGYGSVNMSYWRSSVDAASSLPEEGWRGRGMDVGGTLRSGQLSMSGNLSFYTAGNIAALNNTAESNMSGSLFFIYSRAAWPKLSAGVTNYEYQQAFFDYAGSRAQQPDALRGGGGFHAAPVGVARSGRPTQVHRVLPGQQFPFAMVASRHGDRGPEHLLRLQIQPLLATLAIAD
jgi:hypothetical protein